MLKKVNKKNKKVVFLIWIVIFFILAFLTEHIVSPYINISLVLNTFSSLSPATNNTRAFYGENIDMSQLLPNSQHYIVNSKGQDLIDIAADLGINLIRITNGKRSFNNDADSVYTAEQWKLVLDKMQRKGIRALILIEVASNNGDYYVPDIHPIYLHLVQKYINSGVFSNPNVYAVDLKNEPLLTDNNIIMLQAAHEMIKEKYPHLKQTIGWWATPKSPEDPYNPNNYDWSDYSAGQKLDGIVDFYSIHMYGGLDSDNLGTGLRPDLRTKEFISQVENGLQTTKPILIEEFGEANGDAVSDQGTIGSPELQANIYQGVYQALKEMHSSQILGAVAFDFYSRNEYSDAWAIVKNDGNYLFPAAYILQEYALGKSSPSLRVATTVTSHSYLMSNSDNHTIKNLYLSDRIGFKLQLDDRKQYFLSLSRSGILQNIEALHYDSNFYYATYKSIGRGSVQINVFSNSNCHANNTCASPVYTLAITIQ